MGKGEKLTPRITYQRLFWLYLSGSLLGVLLEGVWTLMVYGWWETHVVSVFGPFCILYGIGAAGCYAISVALRGKHPAIRFAVFAFAGSGMEFFVSFLLQYVLHMKAWDYSKHHLNLQGRISLEMTLLWGAAGLIFSCFAIQPLEKVFRRMRGIGWRIAAILLSVILALDLIAVSACLLRWRDRHLGEAKDDAVGCFIDRVYDDGRMEKRFIEWDFTD